MIYEHIGKRKYKVYAMDIETHNDEESIAKMETSMWLGCFINDESKVEDESSYFYTMDEFIQRLDDESSYKRNKKKTRLCRNVAVYIYNLSFEWSFLLPVLLQHGYKFSETITDEDEYVFNSISTKSCSSVWEVHLKCGKTNGMIILRDLAKLYGGGLGAVAEAFKLETQKGSIDYRLNRLHGHIVTHEEKEYCFKDTRIIIEILLHMDEFNDKDFWQSTSMASYSMRKLLKYGYPRTYKPYIAFRKDYPILGEEETAFLRNSVAGGLCFANENSQFKVINQKIGHIDAHQMHPSSAYYNWFPYGEGEYFQGEPLIGRICCCRILISYKRAIFHSVIQLIGIPFIDEYELTVWDFEIPTMYKCYEGLEIEYLDGYAYKMKTLPWKRYYADNYHKRLKAKENHDAFYTLYYKLLNNSSYGKLLEKPHNEIRENIINEYGIIDSIDTPKENIKINAKYTYLGVGSCIPAYSRVNLIEMAYKLDPTFKKILYVDTDSIFFILDEHTQKVWDEEFDHTDFLGGWGWEETINRAQFATPKRYKVEVDEDGEVKTTFKAGGINFTDFMKKYNQGKSEDEKIDISEVPFDEINIINSKYLVQRAFRCKGGTIIEFQEKEVKVPDKYLETFNKNML